MEALIAIAGGLFVVFLLFVVPAVLTGRNPIDGKKLDN